MNALWRLRSLKLKLGIVIVAAIAVAVTAVVGANALGLAQGWGVLAAVALSLLIVHLLAKGTTSRLREMAAAAEAMARGEHGQQVEVRGRDEVARLAESFNAMSAELAETDRQRRELVANVSHELRTPLSALKATLENIIDGVQEPDERTLLAAAAQVARLERMVEQLLDLSRMESEGLQLEPTDFDVAAMIARACAESETDDRAGVKISARIQPSGLRWYADGDRIHQVVRNLVDNALRYSPEGGAITVAVDVDANGWLRLSVADEGPGIPDDERGRVFERFYSLDPSRSGGGAGLGLAICKWIVELHGGRIRIADNSGHGCKVLVELPPNERTVPHG